MKKERKDSTRNHIKAMLALFCVMFIVLSVYLGYIVNVYGNRWFASPYNTRVANRKGTIAAGMLLDRNGVRLAYTNSEGKRKKMIEEMNTGRIRVLIGSTDMLGTGVNAQRRAVAIHHLDTPWRPSDLAQRDERADRKANQIAKQ